MTSRPTPVPAPPEDDARRRLYVLDYLVSAGAPTGKLTDLADATSLELQLLTEMAHAGLLVRAQEAELERQTKALRNRSRLLMVWAVMYIVATLTYAIAPDWAAWVVPVLALVLGAVCLAILVRENRKGGRQ